MNTTQQSIGKQELEELNTKVQSLRKYNLNDDESTDSCISLDSSDTKSHLDLLSVVGSDNLTQKYISYDSGLNSQLGECESVVLTIMPCSCNNSRLAIESLHILENTNKFSATSMHDFVTTNANERRITFRRNECNGFVFVALYAFLIIVLLVIVTMEHFRK